MDQTELIETLTAYGSHTRQSWLQMMDFFQLKGRDWPVDAIHRVETALREESRLQLMNDLAPMLLASDHSWEEALPYLADMDMDEDSCLFRRLAIDEVRAYILGRRPKGPVDDPDRSYDETDRSTDDVKTAVDEAEAAIDDHLARNPRVTSSSDFQVYVEVTVTVLDKAGNFVVSDYDRRWNLTRQQAAERLDIPSGWDTDKAVMGLAKVAPHLIVGTRDGG